MTNRQPFTDRQMEVLRYRRLGLTQQQVADIIRTTKANVCMIEKSAMRRIERAKETLNLVAMLDARQICTLEAGTDLLDAAPLICAEAGRAGMPVPDDPMALITRIRERNPDRIQGRLVKENISVYLRNDGELWF